MIDISSKIDNNLPGHLLLDLIDSFAEHLDLIILGL
jgi:hypothetical protein